MSNLPPDDSAVTVVIPTLALAERATLLRRAIDSVRSQEGVRALALVVVNGGRWFPELVREIGAEPGVTLVRRDEADLPRAHRAGREAVRTPLFGSLDDDDVLLPGALALRVRALRSHPAADVVVTNGYLRGDGGDRLHIAPDVDVAGAPFDVFRRRNWLLPGSWLARSERVSPAFYDGMPRYRECTYLALRFASEHAFVWDPTPTVAYSVGSPASASASSAYLLGEAQALREMLALGLPLPRSMQRHLRREVDSAHHDAADFFFREGQLDAAWQQHARSLRLLAGLRYVPFTRHLVTASMRRALARPGWSAE